jgi:cytochrome c-type biogenesis protein CcmE
VELTPRSIDERPAVRPRRPALTVLVIVVLVAGAGFVVWQGLSSATRYFYNADQAVARREELGDRRFRLQGTVIEDAETEGEGVRFAVAFNDVEVDVVHAGEPEELFRVGIPVVLEGRWADDGAFHSDEMFVKHSNEYRAEDEYDERVREAETGGTDSP